MRTSGRFGSYGGDGAKSWLLIKHRDDWAGALDIAEFAPRSVKSDGDFEDILAADNPDVWVSNRPAKTGETGAMLADIIKKAAALKAQRATTDQKTEKAPAKATPSRKTAARKTVRAIDAERPLGNRVSILTFHHAQD